MWTMYVCIFWRLCRLLFQFWKKFTRNVSQRQERDVNCDLLWFLFAPAETQICVSTGTFRGARCTWAFEHTFAIFDPVDIVQPRESIAAIRSILELTAIVSQISFQFEFHRSFRESRCFDRPDDTYSTVQMISLFRSNDAAKLINDLPQFPPKSLQRYNTAHRLSRL